MKTYNQTKFASYIQIIFFSAFIGSLAAGCATYQQQNHAASSSWQRGDLPKAVMEITKKTDENAHGKDAVIWYLEQGAVLRANGQYQASNQAFDQAQASMDQYAEAAKIKVGREAAALLSNQAELPYEGRAYDGILLNTYEALNYLALGQIDRARPELRRAYERQQGAVEANQRRIEEVQAEIANNPNGAAIQKAEQDPKFQAEMQGGFDHLDQAYANYVNPFTVYLDGLYFLANATDASDLEQAHKDFTRVASFAPDNDYVRQDLALTDEVINGKSLPPTTYVIFETGSAPVRGQIRINIPIIVSKVSYVGAAFPILKLQSNYLPTLTVTANGMKVATAPVASLDRVISHDFKNELPMVITKTIAATVVKAVAAYAANQAAGQQNAYAGLFSQIGTAAYQAGVNIADERTWTTLPKEFQVAHFSTPTDRKIALAAPNGVTMPVTIKDGIINVVYVKAINAMTPLLVSQFKLR